MALISVTPGLIRLLRELVKVDGLRWIRPFTSTLSKSRMTCSTYTPGEEKSPSTSTCLFSINDRMLTRMHRLGNRTTVRHWSSASIHAFLV